MIVVTGAGSMGSMFGGLLSRAGHDVTLVDVNAAHMAAVVSDGLTLQFPDGRTDVVRPHATTDPSTLRDVSLVIVLTKSFATRDAAAAIRHALRDDAVVVTVQNGLGNDRALAEVLGEHRVLGGTTTSGAELLAPGRVALSPITASGASLTECAPVRAELNTDVELVTRANAAAALLTGAGLPTHVCDSIDGVVWKKLCLAATAAPLTAALRCTVADLLGDGSATKLLRAMFDEIIAVAVAEGVSIDADYTWQHAMTTFSSVGAHQTSMAVDVAKGRRTEIDAMCGEIARRGRLHGVPTPHHDVIGTMIRAIEETNNIRSR